MALLSAAHALAMEPRSRPGDDDHHPLFLHPGRTVLILLRDAARHRLRGDGRCCGHRAEDAPFRLDSGVVREHLGDDVADLVEAVPLPGLEEAGLAEALVTSDEAVRLVALAERLDHARHGHLRDADDAWRRRVHAQATGGLPPGGGANPSPTRPAVPTLVSVFGEAAGVTG